MKLIGIIKEEFPSIAKDIGKEIELNTYYLLLRTYKKTHDLFMINFRWKIKRLARTLENNIRYFTGYEKKLKLPYKEFGER